MTVAIAMCALDGSHAPAERMNPMLEKCSIARGVRELPDDLPGGGIRQVQIGREQAARRQEREPPAVRAQRRADVEIRPESGAESPAGRPGDAGIDAASTDV